MKLYCMQNSLYCIAWRKKKKKKEGGTDLHHAHFSGFKFFALCYY